MVPLHSFHDNDRRRRWTRPNGHLFVRHDAWRFMPPGAPRYVGKDVVRYGWPERKAARPSPAAPPDCDDIDAEIAAERDALLQLRDEVVALKVELKWQRFWRTLKYGFDPDQPRMPAGNPDGGQWTHIGGDAGASTPGVVMSDATPDPIKPGAQYAQDDPNGTKPNPRASGSDRPKRQLTAGQEASRIAKQLAPVIALLPLPTEGRSAAIVAMIKAASFLNDRYYPEIQAYLDPPKSLEELQEAVSERERGYDIHHIVEQAEARRQGDPESQINGSDNLVRIPTIKHWEINAWYLTPSDDFGGFSPRKYLYGKSWDERRRVGLDALVEFGVLKP